jgi:enoyl-CoA hydratase
MHIERQEFGAGALLRLSKPPVNALWIDLLDELAEACEREVEAGTGAIVLTGAGTCFSAGIDTKEAAVADSETQIACVHAVNRTVKTLFGLPVPVVAAVNGHALGGGLVIPLACDLVLSTSAPCKLGLNEVAAGVPFPAVALAAVRARLAPPVFNNLCLTGRTFGPQEALTLGVVGEVCDGDLIERAGTVAAELAGYPAYARVKEQVRREELAEMEELAEHDPMLDRWLRA